MIVEELQEKLSHFHPKMEVKLVDNINILNIKNVGACVDMDTNKSQCHIYSDTPTRWDKYEIK